MAEPRHTQPPVEPTRTHGSPQRGSTTNYGNEQQSGPGTAAIVVMALVALAVIVFLGFTFMGGDRGSDNPDNVNVNVETPMTENETPSTDSQTN